MGLSLFGAIVCLIGFIPLCALFVAAMLPGRRGGNAEDPLNPVEDARRNAFAEMAAGFEDGYSIN